MKVVSDNLGWKGNMLEVVTPGEAHVESDLGKNKRTIEDWS